jgi:hypothetical protein
MTSTEIMNRLSVIERDIEALKMQGVTAPLSHPIQAVERIHGTFVNDAAFKEAARLGREWRESDRPQARKSKAKRK